MRQGGGVHQTSFHFLESPLPPTSWWSLAKPTGPLSRNSAVAERKVLHRSWKKIPKKWGVRLQNLDVDISLLTPPCPPARRSIKFTPRIWKLNWLIGIWFLLFFLSSPLFAFAPTQVTFGPGVFWLLCTLSAVHCTLSSPDSWYVNSSRKVVCLKRNKDNLTGC